jgi:uncharacterized protein YrrD
MALDDGRLGRPVGYPLLPDGVPVYDVTGTDVGTVAHVLADDDADIFHGIVIRTSDSHVFADRTQIDSLYERGVTVAVGGNSLHEPAEDPVAQAAIGSLRDNLRRAWAWLQRPV